MIVGMRRKLIHDSFEIDFDNVWRAAKDDAPE